MTGRRGPAPPLRITNEEFWHNPGGMTAMAQIGAGQYTYELIPDFFKLPRGKPSG